MLFLAFDGIAGLPLTLAWSRRAWAACFARLSASALATPLWRQSSRAVLRSSVAREEAPHAEDDRLAGLLAL